MRQAHRFSGPGQPYEGLTRLGANGPIWTGEVRLVPEKLEEPLHWRKPRRVFVNSMSDLFHEDVPEEFIDRVFAVMAICPHTFQVLTKRPERMIRYMTATLGDPDRPWQRADQVDAAVAELTGAHGLVIKRWPLPGVWLGTSVEDRARKGRIDHLRKVPAAVRFLSLEPLLEDLSTIDLTGIGWVIVGGESGPGARPMHPDWARSLRDQCVAAGVPFFFKQWGGWAPEGQHLRYLMDVVGGRGSHESRAMFPDGHHLPDLTGRGHDGHGAVRIFRVGKKAAGRLLDGREWNEFPQAAEEVPRA
jgi:protein gp37